MARDSSGRGAGKGQAAAIGAQLKREIEKAARALTLEIDHELRKDPSQGGTPVDTGHARANWLPSIGVPATAETHSAATHAAAVASLLGYRIENGALYVTNNVPYIGLLNLGHSSQAPLGFVELAMARAEQTIQTRYNTMTIELGLSSFGDAAGGIAARNMASAYSPFGGDP